MGRELQGIILDMRSNRGGLLDQAQSVAEVFIGDGVIFSTQGRHPDSQRTYRSGSRKTAELPVLGAGQRQLGLGGGDRRRRAA